ncbi:ABC transporter ATP-binding protein [Cutibacterium sp.]|uniref:ATP-binding cassette domain-containing protein n=1 Tax=Cutibacterium sp. TaxID=1912221 RepID=UPI0026DBB32B|nr:ABC transporter ATP-binding protein [Cutibacterium sp.]MDO4412550.1 ABC transporter ATP-binding protein [Cutibacterium sp.]
MKHHRNNELRKRVKAVRPGIILNVACDSVGSVAYALIPALTGILVDQVLLEHSIRISTVIIWYLVLLLIGVGFEVGAQLIWWRVLVKFERSVKQSYFESFLASVNVRSEKGAGKEISKVTNEVAKLEMDYLTPMVAIIKDVIAFIVYGVVLAIVASPLITAIVIIFSLLSLALPRASRSRLSSKASVYYSTLEKYTSHIEELISGKLYIPPRAWSSIRGEHWKSATKVLRDRYEYGRMATIADGVSGLATELVMFATFAAAAILCLRGDLTVGTVAASLGYAKAFLSPLGDMLYDFNAINSTRSIRDKYDKSVGELSSEDRDKNTAREAEQWMSEIFSSLKKNVPNIIIDLGERVILRGASGAGKTTLLKAFYAGSPDHGISVPQLASTHIRDDVMYVGSATPIFHGTFRENVTLFGAFDWDEDILKALSNGSGLYERMRGVTDVSSASGGERQFILLSRAFLSGSSVLLLDEAVSALDDESSQDIIRGTMNLAKDKTIIVVDHHGRWSSSANWRIVNV